MNVHSPAAGAEAFVIDRDTHTITLTRDFDAPRARVFEAWTRPEYVSCWWDPAGEPLAICEIDLRTGGAFRFVTRSHPEMPFAGVYGEIAPPDRLAFGPEGTSGSHIVFQDFGGGTRMTLEIRCESADQLEMFLKMGIHFGTARTLDNLVAYMARRSV
jgi:uncharacterized protein YndB with AHSA1/START domain